MRPSSVYANPACPAGCPCDVLRLLHGRHRLGCRLVMILLSHRGWTASAIAELLGCDPATVRRWIHRYNAGGTTALADQPRPGRPRRGGPKLGEHIRRLLAQPRARTIGRIWQQLGRPAVSLRTLRRRVAEVAAWRRPRLVAKGDPNAEAVLTDLRRTIEELPAGAVVLAEDETHLNLLPWVPATWIVRGQRQQVMTAVITRPDHRPRLTGATPAEPQVVKIHSSPAGQSSAAVGTRHRQTVPILDAAPDPIDQGLASSVLRRRSVKHHARPGTGAWRGAGHGVVWLHLSGGRSAALAHECGAFHNADVGINSTRSQTCVRATESAHAGAKKALAEMSCWITAA